MAQQTGNRLILQLGWDTDAVDTGNIHDQLNGMWSEVQSKRTTRETFGENPASTRVAGMQLMRANTLNLVAVADSLDVAEMIISTVSQLRDFLPSRTIIFITDPKLVRPKTWHVDLKINETPMRGGDSGVLFETITFWTDHSSAGHLSSVVSPLLVGELPTFLWWPSGEFANNAIFEDLVEVADRLIFDSARLGADAHAVADYRTLIDEEDDPVVGDFTWLRLAPWRQLVAQFFDPAETMAALRSIDRVNIAYAQERSDRGSGFAAALLISGWLGSRLGWEIIDKMEPRRAGGWTVYMRARPNGGPANQIQIRLTPDVSPGAKFSLRSVELIASGEHQGIFRIQRTDQDDLITSSETESAPFVSRMVYSRRHSTVEMLGEELHRFGPDRVFEDAIRIATAILP